MCSHASKGTNFNRSVLCLSIIFSNGSRLNFLADDDLLFDEAERIDDSDMQPILSLSVLV